MDSLPPSLLLPDYTNLWSNPSYQLQYPDQASSSNRSSNPSGSNNNTNQTTTSSHATSQSHLALLQKAAQSKSIYYHSKGDHLPSRGSSKWKKQVKFYEKQRGFNWNGSAVTEDEEKDLSDEEEFRCNHRDNILSYGHSSIVMLGRGKTLKEEEQDHNDRGGGGGGSSTAHNANRQGYRTNNNNDMASPSAHTPNDNIPTGAAATTTGTTNANNANNATATTGTGATTGNGQQQQQQQQAAEEDMFLGEYTLDHGDSDGQEGGDIIDDQISMNEVDLDAGLQSMD
ncbi:unnamed protein product [Sympodiomycopsis kandeliae]